MLRNYNYILTIMTYPFILVLSYLKLSNIIKNDLYTYLILIMLIIFIPSFIMSLYSASEEILKSDKKWRIILLILLSIFYLPIYYTKYVAKEEKYLGYILFIITIPLTIITITSVNKKISMIMADLYRNYIVINENYVYRATNNLFTINVDKSYRCNSQDIGDYVISCDRLEDDSFIGVYSYDVSYDSEEDIKEKLDFHLKQTIDYIKDSGYDYEIVDNGYENIIQIDYNQNTILISQFNYDFLENRYSLIILKELKNELLSYEEYQKMIDSIYFLNYNDGVSS